MDTIQNFCYTKNPELLNDLPYHIKFFHRSSKILNKTQERPSRHSENRYKTT